LKQTLLTEKKGILDMERKYKMEQYQSFLLRPPLRGRTRFDAIKI